MSEQETLKGILKKIFVGDKDGMEEFAKELCARNGYFFDERYHESYLECLEEEGYREYVITDHVIYEVVECRNYQYDDIFEMKDNGDMTYDFLLSYYNGGCSFSEAIEEAIKNMEKE